jgi:hypothetical protein
VKLRITYGQADVYYQDRTKHPTPEHAADVLRRMERTLHRVWVGKCPKRVDLAEHEASMAEADPD